MGKAASEALYVKAVFSELGYKVQVNLRGDSAAALANTTKLSAGRVRHLQAQELSVKEAIRLRMLQAIKISTKNNIANILTKHIGGLELEGWWSELGFLEVPEAVANCRLVDQMPISTWDTVQLLKSTSASS